MPLALPRARPRRSPTRGVPIRNPGAGSDSLASSAHQPRRPTHSYAQTMLYHIAPSPVVRGTLHAYTPPILQNDTVQNPEQSRPAQAVQATQLLSRGTQAPHASSTCQTTPRAAPVLLLAPYTCLTAALRWPPHGPRLWLAGCPQRSATTTVETRHSFGRAAGRGVIVRPPSRRSQLARCRLGAARGACCALSGPTHQQADPLRRSAAYTPAHA